MSEMNSRKSSVNDSILCEPPARKEGSDGLSAAEGLQLFRAFTGIHDANLRSSIIHLVELLAAASKR